MVTSSSSTFFSGLVLFLETYFINCFVFLSRKIQISLLSKSCRWDLLKDYISHTKLSLLSTPCSIRLTIPEKKRLNSKSKIRKNSNLIDCLSYNHFKDIELVILNMLYLSFILENFCLSSFSPVTSLSVEKHTFSKSCHLFRHCFWLISGRWSLVIPAWKH